MKIKLLNIYKKYNNNFIFKDLNLVFYPENIYSINGNNSSGKSTFLKLISGYISPNKGKIIYNNSKNSITFAAPYSNLIEEMNLNELLKFKRVFSRFINNFDEKKFKEIIEIDKFKKIKFFSSGIKQKIKLALAILFDSKVILLDEPCSNLDMDNIKWFQNLINNYKKDRLIIVASNFINEETKFTNIKLKIQNYNIVEINN